MRKYLITGHGTFSSGLKTSLDLILGKMDHVYIIDAYVDGNTSIESGINDFLKLSTDQDEIIVFTDLMGGSITNQVLRYALRENVHIISGMNLPLLIDILMADDNLPIEQIIESGIINAREQITYVNKLIQKVNDHD